MGEVVPIDISTDRSRQIQYHRCPRARFLGYHFQGIGIMKKRMAVPLATGGYFHVGAGELLQGVDVETAVQTAIEAYREEVERRGLDLDKEDMTAPAEKAAEQLALTEALIRLVNYRVLPEIHSEYYIQEVEREDTCQLFPENDFTPDLSHNFWITHRSRADALLIEKFSASYDKMATATLDTVPQEMKDWGDVLNGDKYLLNWKTTAQWDKRKAKEGRVDLQGLSEAWGIEERLGIRILGVKMIHLLKGQEREDSRRPGVWTCRSPLIRAWINRSGPRTEFAWSFEWKDPYQVNDWGKPVGHKLGKGWVPFFVPDVMPIKEWMHMLNEGEVQKDAGDCLRAQYITPEPHPRTPQQKASFKRQVTYQEVRIAKALQFYDEQAQQCTLEEIDSWLEEFFPQYTHSCNYPSKCQFFDICHGGEDVDDPFSLFIPRVPNHPGELVQIGG